MSTGQKFQILFLCTGNSCRSQMAEGWTRNLHGKFIESYSAGVEAHGLNPFAVRVMREVGIDISQHMSKTVAALTHINFDTVITVCSHADQACPSFPGSPCVVHVSFDDPPRLAASARTEEEKILVYRRVRDEIRDFVREDLPAALGQQ